MKEIVIIVVGFITVVKLVDKIYSIHWERDIKTYLKSQLSLYVLQNCKREQFCFRI